MIPSPEATALVRHAAGRAEVTINRVSGALALLGSSMGEHTLPLDPDAVAFWHSITLWLLDVLEEEANNLDQSLRHDELRVAARQERAI